MSGGFRSPLPAPFFGGGIGAVPNIAPAGFRTPFPCWIGLVGSPQTVTKKKVGRPEGGGRRLRRDELDRLLKEQRDNTFGPRWFEEFKAAELAAREAAEEAENKAQRKALTKAAEAATQARLQLEGAERLPDLEPLTLALEAAAGAGKVKASLDAAKLAVTLANAIVAQIKAAEEEDEEEAISLLMLS